MVSWLPGFIDELMKIAVSVTPVDKRGRILNETGGESFPQSQPENTTNRGLSPKDEPTIVPMGAEMNPIEQSGRPTPESARNY